MKSIEEIKKESAQKKIDDAEKEKGLKKKNEEIERLRPEIRKRLKVFWELDENKGHHYEITWIADKIGATSELERSAFHREYDSGLYSRMRDHNGTWYGPPYPIVANSSVQKQPSSSWLWIILIAIAVLIFFVLLSGPR